MFVKTCRYFFFIFLFFLTTSIAIAQQISPVGKTIGKDKQGKPIHQIHANGIDIGYKLIGTGKPLVMIMGLGGTMDNWPEQAIDILAKEYQLIIMDNRGMGYTTANEIPFTYPLFAKDVIGLMDTLHIKKADVVGWSMGSTITQQLLFSYPDRFGKAVIYATSTDGSAVSKALHGKTPDNPIVARQVNATVSWKTPIDKLKSIQHQVMILVGTNDTIVGVNDSKLIASKIPGAWLVQFKGGTHVLMNQIPVDFANLILFFLNTNETVISK